MPPIQHQLEDLYDGSGKHLGGIYPPLAIDNVLTPAFHQNKALRPAVRALYLTPDNAYKNIGLVWMLPLDISPAVPIPHEIAGALVSVVDAGKTVVIHGATDEAVMGVILLVAKFVGGGHV